jgi:hypothetical protein
MVWIGIGGIILVGFYLIANLLLVGSALDPVRTTQNISQQTWQWSIDVRYLWLIKLLYPLVVSFVNTSQSLGNITPLWLAALPLLLIRQVRERFLRSKMLVQISVVSIVVLILWIVAAYTILEIRYVFFLWILLYLPAAAVLASAPNEKPLQIGKVVDPNEKPLQIGKVVDLLIICILLFSIVRIFYIAIDSYSPVDREGEPQCFDMPFCELVRPVNSIASPGDRVLTLNAYRYYLYSYLFSCSTGPQEYVTLTDLSHQDPESFWTEVVRQGYKYIIYEPNLSMRHLRLGLDLNAGTPPSWMSLETIFMAPEGKGFVYQIQAHSPSVVVEKGCYQNEAGVWQVQTIPD